MDDQNAHLSLGDVHQSIDTEKTGSRWKKLFSFFGPAYLVSVGYMDPGNWATDLAGGSQFGYTLIWVLLMSNLMAMLLQSLSARLGLVQGLDLAQCNRETYPKSVNFILYILAEIAIAACDLAEVLGMAIGLNLLLGIPLLVGVVVTMTDTFLLLYLQKLGMRKMEAFILCLISIIGLCFLLELYFAKPDFGALAKGFIPTIPNHTALYIAIGIIGATVMPHNLYLHSALVQTRKIKKDDASLRKAIKFNIWDSVIALNLAFFVNAAILVLAASVFYTSGNQTIASLQDAHKLLAPLLGNRWASHLFAIALIAAGQSSTVTGTLAGQIIMEGYLHLRINPWMRRMLTRLLAIVPAVLVIWLMGDKEVDNMLVFSQVLLSMQLAFAVVPLIHFVSNKQKMGKFVIGKFTKFASWLVAAIIIYLNLQLVIEQALSWQANAGSVWIDAIIWTGVAGIFTLLIITFLYPLIRERREQASKIHADFLPTDFQLNTVKSFDIIALALDYSQKDVVVMESALQLAKENTKFVLIHIVESASARMVGHHAEDKETQNDKERMQLYVQLFRDRGFEVKGELGFKSRAEEIARLVKESKADLLVVGSHGHKALKDFIFGETIDTVRHMINVPVFIAR